MSKNKSAPFIDKKHTLFGLCKIYDPTVLPRPGLVVVCNRPDQRAGGKPGGNGLPGGGKKRFEGTEEAMYREFADETGLSPCFVEHLYELDEYVYIIMSSAIENEDGYLEGSLIRRIPFDNARRFEPRYNPKTETVLENVIQLFRVKVNWDGSKLQEFLRRRREKLLEAGISPEELDANGVFAPFGSEEAKRLGIEEGIEHPVGSLEHPAGKPAEISGIGLVPLSMFSSDVLKDPPKGYYYNHLRRVIAALPLL